MTIEQAVVKFPLGSFRATVDDGVVRGATFDPTPATRAPRPVRCARRARGVLRGRRRRARHADGRGAGHAVPARGVAPSCAEIPVGSTISYGELARRVGRPKAQRAVGMANASNPVALIVPCHRVIRTGGALGGYAFGLDYKRWLLAHEAPARSRRCSQRRHDVVSAVMAAPNRPPAAASVTFRCHGHPRISGSHTKTVEFTRDADVTGPGDLRARGAQRARRPRARRVCAATSRSRSSAADARDTFTATMSAFFLADDALVFRCGPGLRGRTLGVRRDEERGRHRSRPRARGRRSRGRGASVTIRELGRGDRRGALFVVSVPIGNDDDLSPRARQVLEAADVVLAEDTRRFRDLDAAHRTARRRAGAQLSRPQRSRARRRGACNSSNAARASRS